MTHPALALQKAVFAALVADGDVGAVLGDRIHDAPPRNATFPYASFGEARASDWSTGTEAGTEHRLTLQVWSRERGKAECWRALEAIRAALDDAALTLDGHALVNLRFEAAETRRERDGITWRGVARFRAVTEPA
ncbi:DUF3168 domain-containing protein [Bauldia litoralis]|uniref:DUF3168 domain-containing protein n=1 Tax=Bauldia litoralis TaxID=665467 RepID=A0A1G6CFR5_9HYPH|nr:DUF3168 domain-containing protein [Bauldia litoralis]SDB31582.1 Protein of unknown function [Bauldia litoralis]